MGKIVGAKNFSPLRDGGFKRLSASLHVKEYAGCRAHRGDPFQSPFGITACESARWKSGASAGIIVSIAFRHHCM